MELLNPDQKWTNIIVILTGRKFSLKPPPLHPTIIPILHTPSKVCVHCISLFLHIKVLFLDEILRILPFTTNCEVQHATLLQVLCVYTE